MLIVPGPRRVHEVAKELKRTSKELIAILNDLGVAVKGPNSPITSEEEDRLRAFLFGVRDKQTERDAAATAVITSALTGARLRKKTPPQPPAVEKEAETIPVAAAAPASMETPAAPPPPAEEVKPLAGKPAVTPTETPPAVVGTAPAEVTVEELAKKAKEAKEVKKPAVDLIKPKKLTKPPRPKKAPAKPERPDIGVEIIEEVVEEQGAAITPEALRRLTQAEREERLRVIRSRLKQRPAPDKGLPVKKPQAITPKQTQAPKAAAPAATKAPPVKRVRVAQTVTLGELALNLDVPLESLISYYAEHGRQGVNALALLAPEEQADAARSLGFEVEVIPEPKKLVPRPPVVTVLGHVDHGKTTLLDALRKTNVVAAEDGGITQHIGASVVAGPQGDIVFIDTPGHEIFTRMRARGAQVTDIVVLVVAADDGVMPQTVESISHARAAKVPIVVAITKVDRQEADVYKVKKGLAEHGVTTEDWGGDVLAVEVAAPQGRGLDKLLDAISLQAEMMELKGDLSGRATGVIIESMLDRGRGPVITVLVKSGVLRVGDAFVAGGKPGRVRAMFNAQGAAVKEARPATPVSILGAEGVPAAGDVLVVFPNDRVARTVASFLTAETVSGEMPTYSLDDWFKQFQRGERRDLPILLKGDVAGTVEALTDSIGALGNEEVRVKIVHAGVGAVNESDILLANTSRAVVIAFRVSADAKAKQLAEREGVEIRHYDVVYEVLEDLRAALEGLLEPEVVTEVVGAAEVKQVFVVSGQARVAGCIVRSGRVTRGANARVVREGIVIHEGTVSSLRRYRDDVREVQQGLECGIQIAGFNDIQEGDTIEIVAERKIARRLTEKR